MRSIFRISIIILALGTTLCAQQSETDKALDLYKKDDYASAVKALQKIVKVDQSDATAWFYLGRSYEKLNTKDDAGKTFLHAFDAGYERFKDLLTTYVNQSTLTPFPDFLKPNSSLLSITVASASKATELYGDSFGNEARLKANNLYGLLKIAGSGEDVLWNGKTDKHVVFLKKPFAHQPEIPDWKVQHGGTTVTVILVLGADGKVRSAIPVQKSQSYYDLEAMRAASMIQFEPAEKDGKKVTVLQQFEYTFSR